VSDRRGQILEAAAAVLADGGARALTHRGVDRTAGLPAGSTSNLFRTRDALVEGVVEHLIASELQAMPDLDQPLAGVAISDATLVQMASQAISYALGPGRIHTLARRALFHEAASNPEARGRLGAGAAFWWERIAALREARGAPDPDQRGRWLLAYIDGVIGDQLAWPDPHFNPADAIAPAIHGTVNRQQAGRYLPGTRAGFRGT